MNSSGLLVLVSPSNDGTWDLKVYLVRDRKQGCSSFPSSNVIEYIVLQF